MIMLTWKVGLVEAYDGFGAACAPNGDFLLPAILFELILNTRQQPRSVSVVEGLFMTLHAQKQMCSGLPDSFSAALNARCRSSSQTLAAHPGPIFSCVNGPRGFRTFCLPVGRLCSSQNEDSCNMGGVYSDAMAIDMSVK